MIVFVGAGGVSEPVSQRNNTRLSNKHVHYALRVMQNSTEWNNAKRLALTYVIYMNWCPFCAHTVACCAFQHPFISIVDNNFHLGERGIRLHAVPVITVISRWFAIGRTFYPDVANRWGVWLRNQISVYHWFWDGLWNNITKKKKTY